MAKNLHKIRNPRQAPSDPRIDQILTMLIRLAAEDLTARVTPGEAGDELDGIMVGLNVLAEELDANMMRLNTLLAEQAHFTEEFRLLAEMSSLFQASATLEELYLVIAHFLERLFPSANGALFIYSASRDDLERKSAWGGFPVEHEEVVFKPSDCWGIRRGRVNIVRGVPAHMRCRHVPKSLQQDYLCVPVMGTDGTIGLLHLRFATPEAEMVEVSQSQWEERERIAVTAGEYMGLALVNSRLRQALQQQSIRDPLTDMFNRRYLEETLDREIRRATRQTSPICCLMIDIDHFKLFNDTYSHAAGDTLLREFATLLKKNIRGGDIPSRYGGDEFTLILPDTALSDGQSRAEQIREKTKSLHVVYNGNDLGSITVSIGLAVYPDHGAATVETLLHAADRALYNAKQAGRDRVEVFSPKTQA